MSSFSPTSEGFRLIFRRPAIPLAEIAWRSTFATAAWLLGIAFVLEYMGSLPVNALDRLLLGTQQPILVSRAIHRIFHGSAFRFTEAGIVLAIGLAVAWVALASLGRAATLAALLDEFGVASGSGHRMIRSLVALNFLRVAVFLAAKLSGLGAVLLASSFWASTHVSLADASRIWFALLFLVGMIWAGWNWLLSTAAVFAIEEQVDTLAAIAATVRLVWEQPGQILAALALFGTLHGTAFAIAGGVGLTVLGMTSALGAGPVLFVELLIAMAYVAVTDSLHIGRLAACLAIIQGEELAQSVQSGETPPSRPGLEQTTVEPYSVDPTELILSDAPLPAS